MSVPMLVLALLPTYSQIGISAVIILILARMLQGFSVGGEYTGVLVMLIEQSGNHNRGFFTSIGTFVSGCGVLLSSLVVTILTSNLTQQHMLAWGWRLAFGIGFVLAIFSLFLQLWMHESPFYEKLKKQKKIAKHPMREAIRDHKFALFIVFCLTGYLGIAYYMFAAFFPSFLISVQHLSEHTSMWITTIGAATYAFTAPLWGALSDYIGRKPILIASAAGLTVLIYPIFLLMSSHHLNYILLAEVVLALLISSATAAFVTTINELFPTRHRYSGVSLSYNVSNAIFGGTTPLVATSLIHLTGHHLAPAYYLMFSAFIMLIILFKMPETKGRSLV